MKVYFSVDIEGMEGVVSKLQTTRNSGDFIIARKRLVGDVNAAVQAAVDAGAEEMLVCDGHGDKESTTILK